ncbi:hypothetical protein LA02_1243 [Francisella philomiragia]|uniref:hypothetical protein n=1 Tax=Francisella philomiragia TaxID=28110 RepID=UPI0005A56784|nr:hypothetical protein [Francisella philomiragia]AJI57933.1 hypothetical protein LA02_1243 [Francisella philomiragia]
MSNKAEHKISQNYEGILLSAKNGDTEVLIDCNAYEKSITLSTGNIKININHDKILMQNGQSSFTIKDDGIIIKSCTIDICGNVNIG